MSQLEKILAAIAAAAQVAGGLGIPVAGLIGRLIPIFNELINSIQQRTGKTREEIIAETNITLDSELAILIASDVAGE